MNFPLFLPFEAWTRTVPSWDLARLFAYSTASFLVENVLIALSPSFKMISHFPSTFLTW